MPEIMACGVCFKSYGRLTVLAETLTNIAICLT